MLSFVRRVPTGVLAWNTRILPAAFSTAAGAPCWASVHPTNVSGASPHTVQNLLAGNWVDTTTHDVLPDPMNGEEFMKVPATTVEELPDFVKSLRSCPKSGLHNPLKAPERYVMLGKVSVAAAAELRANGDYFAKLIQRVVPKSYAQAMAEVEVTATFLENFGGDNVRQLGRGFCVPGDHAGQQSVGYRWPFGPVAVISPFNFPLEIPVLQLMGALYMGNRPTLKPDTRVAVVMEQFMRMLIHCGLPATDVDMLCADGPTTGRFVRSAKPRSVQFTGSSRAAEMVVKDTRGKAKIEDAGFDWKVLGPDVPKDATEQEYIAWQCDQDAYACSGQKCSAQSMLFMHRNWEKAGMMEKMAELAARRKLENLTIGPVLTWTTEKMLQHVDDLLKIPGAKVLFGGKALEGHSIPKVYGAIEPTAVYVPLAKLRNRKNFELATTEVFGPLQVVTTWTSRNLATVQAMLERMPHNLTAAVVSNDVATRSSLLSSSVNGTTYAGLRARTTGAPQNHWFGPSGDPRGAGIGTIEAIQMVWSSHREVIADDGPFPTDWTLPEPT